MRIAEADARPVYDWERATVGDKASAIVVEIKAADIQRFAAALGDANPAYRLDAKPMKAPPTMVRLFAPLRRRELVAEQGALYLDHSTPAVRWHCRWHREPCVGDRITSVTKVQDKYERKGRRFLQWRVDAWNQNGDLVLEFDYVNLWDRGRVEDRAR